MLLAGAEQAGCQPADRHAGAPRVPGASRRSGGYTGCGPAWPDSGSSPSGASSRAIGVLRDSGEDEMIACFLAGELSSERFGAAIRAALGASGQPEEPWRYRRGIRKNSMSGPLLVELRGDGNPALSAASCQSPDDEQSDKDRKQRGGVVMTVREAGEDHDGGGDDEPDDERGDSQLLDPAARWSRHIGWARCRHRSRRCDSVRWQVGEQAGQVVSGPGSQCPLGALVEFGGCEPANLEVPGELSDCPISVRVRHPQVAGRVAADGACRR